MTSDTAPVSTVPKRFVLAIRNRQRTRRVDVRRLHQMTNWLLRDCFQTSDVELCLHLVGALEMAEVNWNFLRHEGSTDVITFDLSLSESAPALPCPAGKAFHGEIFISLDDAVVQAKQFRTTWQSELARYVIHGLLHLAGYDDLQPAARRAMKREEHRLLKKTSAHSPPSSLQRPPLKR